MLPYQRLLTLATVEFHPRKLDQIKVENERRVDHWALHLHEVGDPLIKRARDILGLHSQIDVLYEEIQRLEAEIAREEKELEGLARKDWTKADIRQAIKDAKVHIDAYTKAQAVKKKLAAPIVAKRTSKIKIRTDGKPGDKDKEYSNKDAGVKELEPGSRAING